MRPLMNSQGRLPDQLLKRHRLFSVSLALADYVALRWLALCRAANAAYMSDCIVIYNPQRLCSIVKHHSTSYFHLLSSNGLSSLKTNFEKKWKLFLRNTTDRIMK